MSHSLSHEPPHPSNNYCTFLKVITLLLTTSLSRVNISLHWAITSLRWATTSLSGITTSLKWITTFSNESQRKSNEPPLTSIELPHLANEPPHIPEEPHHIPVMRYNISLMSHIPLMTLITSFLSADTSLLWATWYVYPLTQHNTASLTLFWMSGDDIVTPPPPHTDQDGDLA